MSILNRVWKGGISMSILKKLDKMFGKYVGIAFSLLLIWMFKNDSITLASQAFFMSSLVSGLIIIELVVKHKSIVNKSLLICVLIPNFIIAITAAILQLLGSLSQSSQYLYVTRAIAIILIVTLPISYWILFKEIEKAK